MKKIALSFDVEDWFCVRNMRDSISFSDWEKLSLRVEESTNFILNELAKRQVHATFFILGWIAEKCPDLVRSIAEQGHEIATHGYAHQTVDSMTPDEFEADLSRSIEVLTRISGAKITGFRAPSFSVTNKTLWSLPIMKRCGLLYDSSIFPVRHPDYGIENFPTGIQNIGGMLEVPMTSLKVLGVSIPVSGGGYFRMFPYLFSRFLIRRALMKSFVVMYFHPWEFDAQQPRVALPWIKKFRHYVGLARNRKKFVKLLNDFEFVPVRDLLVNH